MTAPFMITKSEPDEHGHWGKFGGRYVPETLVAPLEELTNEFTRARHDKNFWRELNVLLRDYAGRPTPLFHAQRLSTHAGGAQIYLKREDLLHTGAHKINNALGQALLARRMGKHRVIAETGAGQHGVATATVCALFGLRCVIYMGAEDVRRQALNVFRMRLLGADVITVNAGTRTLKDAINEALRDWVTNVHDTYYLLGSALGPHPYPLMVRDFQSVIGREAREQILSATGEIAARAGCMRRWRLECDWIVSSVHRRRRRAIDRRRGWRLRRFVRQTRREVSQRKKKRRRARGRSSGHDVLRAPGHERSDRDDSFHLRRTGLLGNWPRARVPSRQRPSRIYAGERCRSARRASTLRKTGRHHSRARNSPRHSCLPFVSLASCRQTMRSS